MEHSPLPLDFVPKNDAERAVVLTLKNIDVDARFRVKGDSLQMHTKSGRDFFDIKRSITRNTFFEKVEELGHFALGASIRKPLGNIRRIEIHLKK